MSQDQVHYEVFGRANRTASLTLQFATEDRQRALESAEELFKNGYLEVKVYKETLDEETRAYKSVSILNKGVTSVERRKAPPSDQPLCVSPSDLYTPHARDRIGRLLDAWLKRNLVTPFELLHRADLVEILEASGSDLQHAIQKIAVPEAQARGISTHESMRNFQKLTERAMERVAKDAKARRFPCVTPETFPAALATLQADPERSYLIGAGVAAFISAEKTWSAKIMRLLDLADGAPEEPRARAFALSVIEQPLAEILASGAAVADILGEEVDLAASLAAMTRLAASKAVELAVSLDPDLEEFFKLRHTRSSRLATWLLDASFQAVRVSLLRRVLKELRGPRRLRPRSPDEEIEALRALAVALAATAGEVLDAEEVQAAFIERSRSLLGGDFVQAYLKGRNGALNEAQALCRLAENVAGALNKTTAARWLMGSISSLRFEKDARDPVGSPAARLVLLASLQKSVNRACLPQAETEAISKHLGVIGGMVEADSNIVALLARAHAGPVQKLHLLLQLAAGETAPKGPAAERARVEALKLLRKPDTRAELATMPEKLERVRDLIDRAGLAA